MSGMLEVDQSSAPVAVGCTMRGGSLRQAGAQTVEMRRDRDGEPRWWKVGSTGGCNRRDWLNVDHTLRASAVRTVRTLFCKEWYFLHTSEGLVLTSSRFCHLVLLILVLGFSTN